MQVENKRLSMADVIYEKLKNEIIELEYEPGEQLVEATLAEKLDVSRTPLRQALYRLELEGLVHKKLNGRMQVANMSMKEANKLFGVREVIEGLIAREATQYIVEDKNGDAIIEELENAMEYMRVAAKAGHRTDVVKYGTHFHALLEVYSRNTVAANVLTQINQLVLRYRRFGVYSDPDYDLQLPVCDHERVLKCIKEKDSEGAEVAMRYHIRRSLKNTTAALSKREYFRE